MNGHLAVRYLQGGSQLVVLLVAMGVFLTMARPVSADEEHACHYLTREDVAKVTGGEVAGQEANPANPLGQSTCFYDLGTGLGLQFAQLQMVRTGWTGLAEKGFTAASLFTNNMNFLENKEEVAGIGEKAYWGGAEMKLGSGLHVLAKNSYFTVLVKGKDKATSKDQSLELAQVIIGKL